MELRFCDTSAILPSVTVEEVSVVSCRDGEETTETTAVILMKDVNPVSYPANTQIFCRTIASIDFSCTMVLLNLADEEFAVQILRLNCLHYGVGVGVFSEISQGYDLYDPVGVKRGFIPEDALRR